MDNDLRAIAEQLAAIASKLQVDESERPEDVYRKAGEAFARVVELQGRIVGLLERQAEVNRLHDEAIDSLAKAVLALQSTERA